MEKRFVETQDSAWRDEGMGTMKEGLMPRRKCEHTRRLITVRRHALRKET